MPLRNFKMKMMLLRDSKETADRAILLHVGILSEYPFLFTFLVTNRHMGVFTFAAIFQTMNFVVNEVILNA